LQGKSQNGLRRLLRWTWIYFLYYSGLIFWARRRVLAVGGVVVLTLHRVLEDLDFEESNSPRGMIVRRSSFEQMLEHLRARYKVLSLRGHPPSWEKTATRPRFAVTFDDGWKDTSDVAFLEAQRLAVPMTVFICPGLLGKVSPFWPEKVARAWRFVQRDPELREKFLRICKVSSSNTGSAGDSTDCHGLESILNPLKELPVQERERVIDSIDKLMAEIPSFPPAAPIDRTMSWEDVSYLNRQGAQIGSHTYNHQILTRLSISEAERELADSKQVIERALGENCMAFSYPNGDWSPEIRDLVIQGGYRQAFTTEIGIWTADTDPWLIPRVNIWEGSIIGPSGRFSPVVFEYATVWRGDQAQRRKPKRAGGSRPQRQVR